MRAGRVAVGAGAGLGLIWLGLNAAVAFAAAHPIGQGKLLGTGSITRRSPADEHLAYQDIEYGPRRDGWWIPAASGAPTVVMVPGYSPAPDPKSTDSSPSVELAGAFHSWGYNTLIINPGYATGAHPYTGGPLEAKDIKMAVSWCHHHGGNVAVWGFSAGGHSSLLAAANGASITAVAADSAFVNAQAVIAEQAARVVHLPGAVFFPAPRLLRWWYPPGPADLRSELRTHPIKVPVLLIQGTADTAIAPTNLQELARLTGGTVWSVPGADHTKSYFTDRSGYLQRARAFLEAHLPPGNPAAR